MGFLSRHRVLLVLLGLGIVVVRLVGYRIKQQQAAAVPRRQLEVVVGVARPVRKDLDVKLSYTADEAQLGAARSQIATQESQIALARSNIEREGAALRIAQTNLDNTRVLAPFTGYISARNLDLGAAGNSEAAATSNSSVGIMVRQDLEVVKVQGPSR
jgi:multidrug resistance efflux pump